MARGSDPIATVLAVGGVGVGVYALMQSRRADPAGVEANAGASVQASPTVDAGRSSSGAAPTSGNPATQGPTPGTAKHITKDPGRKSGVSTWGRPVGDALPYSAGARVRAGGRSLVFIRHDGLERAAVWGIEDPGSRRGGLLGSARIPWDRRPSDFDWTTPTTDSMRRQVLRRTASDHGATADAVAAELGRGGINLIGPGSALADALGAGASKARSFLGGLF